MARKKPIISPLGQWAYPGEVTIIPSSDITMKGVNYPVLGIDDLGNQQMMMPGQDYTFPGDYVTEIPQMGKGGLAQWFDEKWVDVKTGKACGRSGKDKDGRPYPACRPSKRVNETTPKTTSEMSSSEKAKFKREKTSGKRIDYNHKRRQDGGEWLDDEPEVNPKIGWNSGNRYSYDKKGNLIYTNHPLSFDYDVEQFIEHAINNKSGWLGNSLNDYEIDFLKNAKNKIQNLDVWPTSLEFQVQTQVDKLNPSLDELINVTQNIYPDQYAIDNSFSKASKSRIDLPTSAFENDIKERYVIPEILKNSINKRFGTLPTTRDDSYSPNRIWTTKVKNDEDSNVGARFATNEDNSKYAYILTPNSKKASDLSKEKINTKKENIENLLSSADNKFYENLYLKYPDYIQYPGNYNNPEIGLFGDIKNILPNQMWNRAEQMRVEMLNNPEIKDWADLHNVNLSRGNEDSKQNLVIDGFAPKVPESAYANRLVKAGLPVSTPDYSYGADDTYIVQDPSKFNLAGYFPIPKDYDEENAKQLIAKKLGIKPEQLNNKDYLIHYNKSPITEYTPGKKYGGWLDQFQTGGIRPPIYTSNPRKVQLYQDSLNLYNKYQPSFDKYKNWTRLNNIQTASLQGNDLFNQYWGPNKPKGPSPYNENIIIKPVEEMMHHYLRPRSGVVGGFTHLYEKPGNNYLETKISDYLTPNPKQTYHWRAKGPDGKWLPYNVRLTASQIKSNAARKSRMWPVSVTKEDFLDLGLTGVTPDLNSVFRFKKPVQPYVYKKPEVVSDVVNTPVVEPPKPSLFVSNIDRDMYTPGGGMAREYNIGVRLQDGNRKSFRTEKEFQDWKAANNLDISKAKVTEGRGYSYDYPENKKYGGWLSKYQTGGGWAGWTPNVGKPYMRTSPAGNAGYSDNTRVVNQNTNVSAANRKAAEAAEYAKRVGSISQGETKSAYEKAREASSFVSQAERRNGSASPLDYVLDMVNPATYGFAGIDLVGNTAMGVNNLVKGNFSEAAGNTFDAGMNALYILPAAAELRGPLRSAGKYLTTQTPLKNTYKYNPWAFKPNEANWYRQVGQSAIDDIKQTGLIREAGEEVSPRMWGEFQNQIKRLQGDDAILDYNERYMQQRLAGRRPVSPFFAKGELFYPMDKKVTMTKSGKISKNPAAKGTADYLIETDLANESFQPAYVKGMYPGVPEEIGSTAILKPNPALRNIDNFKLYKKDWLRGYKPIDVPSAQPISKPINYFDDFDNLTYEGTRDLYESIPHPYYKEPIQEAVDLWQDYKYISPELDNAFTVKLNAQVPATRYLKEKPQFDPEGYLISDKPTSFAVGPGNKNFGQHRIFTNIPENTMTAPISKGASNTSLQAERELLLPSNTKYRKVNSRINPETGLDDYYIETIPFTSQSVNPGYNLIIKGKGGQTGWLNKYK